MAGIEEIWNVIGQHRKKLTESGEYTKRRREQARDWVSFLVREGLTEWFYTNSEVVKLLPMMLQEVEKGDMSPTSAAAKILSLLKEKSKGK
jgi:LAO/AO transport system kinase